MIQFADLLLETPDSYPMFAVQNDGMALDAGSFGSLSPFFALPDFALPSIELEPPVSNSAYSATAATKTFTATLRSEVEGLPSASASPSRAVAYLDPSGDTRAYQNAALQAPVMSVDPCDANFEFGGGFHLSPSYYTPALGGFQAIVQVIHAQERIARIDLRRREFHEVPPATTWYPRCRRYTAMCMQ